MGKGKRSREERDREKRKESEQTMTHTVKLSSYEPVRVTVPRIIVTDDDVDEQMRKAAADIPYFKQVEGRPVEDKDRVVLTMVSKDSEGREFGNLTREHMPIYLGDEFVPKGLAEEVVGMEIGQTKTICFEAPTPENDADGNAIMADIISEVTVEEIMSSKQSGLTDEWVASAIPNAKTVEEFRAVVRNQLEAKAKQYMDGVVYESCAAELARRVEDSISDDDIMKGKEEQSREFESMLKESKVSKDTWLAKNGMTAEQLDIQFMIRGREMIAEGMALEAMADHIDPEVTDRDIDDVFGQVSPAQAKLMREQFKQQGRMEELWRAARSGKAMDYVVRNAIIEYRTLGNSSLNPFATDDGQAQVMQTPEV